MPILPGTANNVVRIRNNLQHCQNQETLTMSLLDTTVELEIPQDSTHQYPRDHHANWGAVATNAIDHLRCWFLNHRKSDIWE